ncbi:pyridoxal phosphate-dependent aminotransferase [Hungatella effluvii]|uniref:pyridoxal phosphate-dependent aminotransferase n=1 Tax=Hungatella effluvii TaxID=1096246 RepID=UPI002A801C0F|nr:histidinol-phosphate transaminase [Hungatella effluvii]
MENDIFWLSITEKQGNDCLDFSVNVNPLGIPDTVIKSISKLPSIMQYYPDPGCTEIIKLLSSKYGVSASNILCGNGADDLLYRLVFSMKPKQALIIEPTFEEYNRALQLVGCEVQHYQLNPLSQFELDENVLTAIVPDMDMVFLCNPNNPTGRLIQPHVLYAIIDKCQENNITLVVDECFMEFLPNWKQFSMKEATKSYSNLVVLDAFTKTYSLAGFRIGFCMAGCQSLISDMKLQGQSFAVSVPAQFAGICALMDYSYMEKTYSLLEAEKMYLLSQLAMLGVDIIPPQANYILFKTPYKNIRELFSAHGIKIRDCSKFYGLGSEYCRIAIRPHRENVSFIEAAKTIISKK